MTMALWSTSVFLLCFATSVLCAWLLVRSYLVNRTALLLWTAACFVLLAVNNSFVVIDLILLPEVDFALLRTISALAAVGTLLYGFIWEID
jgi:hypothetical protein